VVRKRAEKPVGYTKLGHLLSVCTYVCLYGKGKLKKEKKSWIVKAGSAKLRERISTVELLVLASIVQLLCVR